MNINDPELNEETGEWEVTIDGGVYSFVEESEAAQFYNLQMTFLGEDQEDRDGEYT